MIAAKRLFRAVLQNDFREALAEMRASDPGLFSRGSYAGVAAGASGFVAGSPEARRDPRWSWPRGGAADEDDARKNARKNARIKRLAGELKRAHPTWSFDRCWSEARSEQPHLFESD